MSASDLLFGSRSIEGALTGDPAAGEATLKFSALTGIVAMIETVPLEQAAEAYAPDGRQGAVPHGPHHGKVNGAAWQAGVGRLACARSQRPAWLTNFVFR